MSPKDGSRQKGNTGEIMPEDTWGKGVPLLLQAGVWKAPGEFSS